MHERGVDVSLREIARKAEAGLETLLRHGARLLARAWGAVMARIDGADLFALPATLRSARRSALARTMRRPPLRGPVGSR